MPTFAQHGWVQSSLELLRELWVKCTTSAECKTVITAVVAVMIGLDPHMTNLSKHETNSFIYVDHVYVHAYAYVYALIYA